VAEQKRELVMPLNVNDVASRLDNFLSEITSALNNDLIQKGLPLIGKIGEMSDGGSIDDKFTDLQQQIQHAFDNPPGGDPVDAIVQAINGLGLAEVHAAKNDATGGVDVTFALSQSFDAGTGHVAIGGGDLGFMHLEADTGATGVATLSATLSFAADGSVSLADTGTPEVNLHVDAKLSPSGSADLGVAKVSFTDHDTAFPELSADFGFDLGLTAGNFTIDPKLSGSLGLDLDFATTDVLDVGGVHLLPDMKGEFIVGFGIDNDEFTPPTVQVDHLKLDLGSYIGIVGDTFKDLAKIFNSTPFDELIDLLTTPIPALNDIAHTLDQVGRFDRVGALTGGPDQIITIGDLAAVQNPNLEPTIDLWYRALNLISQIRKLDQMGGAGEIDLGGAVLAGGVPDAHVDLNTLVADIKAKLATLGLPSEVTDFLSDIDIGGLDGSGGAAPSSGFSFNLFEHPEDAFKILLTNEPVDLVKFDVPPLGLDQAYGGFFPILGPLGVLLEGAVKAKVDIDVGYDTKGLIDHDFTHGFFITTAAATLPTTEATKWQNPAELPYLPVGTLDTKLTGGAGIGFAGSSITANVQLGFGVYTYFEAADADGKFRPAIEDFECIFHPIGGRSDISVNVTIKVGFGPFHVTKNIPLAGATLADFTIFTCPPATVEATPQAPGLATAMPDASLALNVGDRAGERKIGDDHGNVMPIGQGVANESYVIALARDAQGDNLNPAGNPAPVIVPGKLDVSAFGFTQRVDIPTVITAHFTNGDDMLVIQRDVAVDSDISGGIGNDTLMGGAGSDKLHGDADNDYLAGNDGNDFLYGDGGDDQLAGGKGGDRLDGGEGFDTVDYSGANRDTHQGVTVTITKTGDVFGHGGEAEGDTLVSIESLIGTDYNDDFRAGFGVTQGLVFDGGAGDDILIGGTGEDLLIGGAGADLINGDDAKRPDGTPGVDGTTYVTSWGGVEVDLTRTVQRYGDAEGDKLFNIEAVEGSTRSDTLRGNASDNLLNGNDGNDTLEGRGGKDVVSGDFGNDLIYGGADGDTLDGGADVDTLSYEHVGGPVTVDLGIGLGASGDTIAMVSVANHRSTFENLIGTASSDTLKGDTGDNRIEGRDGNDVIAGDAGADILIGGAGGDQLSGGTGVDWVYYNDSSAGVTVDLGQNFGTGGTAQGDTFDTVENILGSRFVDDLRGDGGNNIIDPNISRAVGTEHVDGRGGVDTLRVNYGLTDTGHGVVGGFSRDQEISDGTLTRSTASGDQVLNFQSIEHLDLVGTRRADTIYGGDDWDRIATGAGDDTIYSGRGADDVRAGSGNDHVFYGNDYRLRLTGELAGEGRVPFHLDGGSGIDTLSLALDQTIDNVVLIGSLTGGEVNGTNLSLSTGGGIANFEILGDIYSGSGDDTLLQLGDHNNIFQTGVGDDVIAPGLGIDDVDGGFDHIGIVGSPGDTGPFITDLFFERKGDLLVLDYSSLTGYGVTSSTTSTQTGFRVNGSVPLLTNSGFYEGFGADPDAAAKLHLDFNEIERMSVTGSNQSDVISGTYIPLESYFTPNSPDLTQTRGDDVLDGLGGNDLIFGYSGDDVLRGGAGDDILVGGALPLRDSYAALDDAEVDTLTGGAGADLFVLGVAGSASGQYVAGLLYDDRGNDYSSSPNQAVLTDFNPLEGDHIQLFGQASDYRTVESNGATLIYLMDGIGGTRADDELIATVENFTGLALDANYVVYVDRHTPAMDFTPVPQSAPVQPFAALFGAQSLAAFSATAAASLGAGFTVTTTDDVDALKAMLDGGAGVTNSSLTLSGSAEAFGTFENDPFGLGSGIILSTGAVEDLPGPNTVENGGTNITQVPVTFEKIGRLGGTTDGIDVYRLDLSTLGVSELRSLTLRDTNAADAGGVTTFTGFDLATTVISTKKLANLDGLTSPADLDDPANLPKLDVFDYSAASTHYFGGRERNGGSDDLNGTINSIVKNGQVELGNFGFDVLSATKGSVSLGDGGFIQFDLTHPVSTTGTPLYLYVAEYGTPEQLTGTLTASPDSARPSGDLSTDLGAPGLEDDTTSLTYTFTPKAGDTGFSLDVVLFSEELPEFDGATSLSDLFSITLNGVEIGALSNGAALSIQDLVYSGSGDLVYNPVGTGPLADQIKADAYTKTLRISGAVDPGVANTLSITLKDQRDAFLDSGLLVKDGSFRTFKLPDLSVGFGGGLGADGNGSSGTIIVGSHDGSLTITPPADIHGPVQIVITPDEHLQIPGAGGPGAPIVITFNPGDGPKQIPIEAAPGVTDGTGTVHYEVHSEDPGIDGLAIAPDLFGIATRENAGFNTPPVNTLPAVLELEANVANALGVSIADADAGSGSLTTTLAVQLGTLDVGAAGGASVSGSGSTSVTLTGTLGAIDAALATVTYRGPTDFFGNDHLTMTTDDHGNTGPGGPLTDIDLATIHLNTHLVGTPEDDSFHALPGNEFIEALHGHDSVTFDFALVDATVTYRGDKIVIDGPNHSHTLLSGFERYVFTDGTVENADKDYLVDDLFYYSRNHDVWLAHVDADAHYHSAGWREGRDPDAFFDTKLYQELYPDTRNSDPLKQFDESGWKTGRIPSLSFDGNAYLASWADVVGKGFNPLTHFLTNGHEEGRQPIAIPSVFTADGFDYIYYLNHNPDVAASGLDAYQHFETIGWKEGRNPNAWFDTSGYLSHYADVAAAGVNPLTHYHQTGWQEGRDPSVNFDTTDYLAHYTDVAAAHVDPVLHFLQHGQTEGRSTFADGVWG
jgi:Ca2+-binding RTX toxin-like protein